MYFSREVGTSLRSKEFGLGSGKKPRPSPKFVVLLLALDIGRYCGIEAGWKLYENLLAGKAYFLLTGIIEFKEPMGFSGLERYVLYELSSFLPYGLFSRY